MTIKKMQALSTQEARVIKEIYNQKSIHMAANVLNATPNYVNVTLLRLEFKLGCQLFQRRQKTGMVEVTKIGENVIPELIKFFDIYLWIIEYLNQNNNESME
jgi:DNA-binding transcriptional LysR family regulator